MARVSDAHLEARRQSILDAAMAVFSQKGYQAATMAEVAQEAGISPGAIYRYFESKVELVHTCFKQNAEAVAEEWSRETAGAPDGLAALSLIAKSSFSELLEDGAEAHTALNLEYFLEAMRPGNEELRERVWAEREVIVNGLREVLERARSDGSLPGDIDPYLLAQALMSLYIGARVARMLNSKADIEGSLAQVQHLLDHARAAAGAEHAAVV